MLLTNDDALLLLYELDHNKMTVEEFTQHINKKAQKMISALGQILVHASEENQSIAKADGKFGADELQAIRIKAKRGLNNE